MNRSTATTTASTPQAAAHPGRPTSENKAVPAAAQTSPQTPSQNRSRSGLRAVTGSFPERMAIASHVHGPTPSGQRLSLFTALAVVFLKPATGAWDRLPISPHCTTVTVEPSRPIPYRCTPGSESGIEVWTP